MDRKRKKEKERHKERDRGKWRWRLIRNSKQESCALKSLFLNITIKSSIYWVVVRGSQNVK